MEEKLRFVYEYQRDEAVWWIKLGIQHESIQGTDRIRGDRYAPNGRLGSKRTS